MQIRKAYHKLMLTMIVSTLAVFLHLMVDAIVIGQYLGAEAIAAAGLVSPLTNLFLVCGMMLGFGSGLVCIKYMGMADMKRANTVFSTATTLSIVQSLSLSFFMFFFAHFLAGIMASSADNPLLIDSITGYLKGYAFILPASWLIYLLSNILAADNDYRRVVIGMMAALIFDTVFDFANVLIFKGGLFGMAMASTLSQYISLAVLLTHFLRTDKLFVYHPGQYDVHEIINIIESGVNHVFRQGSVILRKICINAIFMAAGSLACVTAFSISQSVYAIAEAVAIGIMGAGSMATSLFYGERNKKQLEEITAYHFRVTILILTITGALIGLGAPVLVRVFLKGSGAESDIARSFIQCQAVQIVLISLSCASIGICQGTGRFKTSYAMTVLQDGVFPVVGVFLMSKLSGLDAAKWGFILSGFLAIAAVLVMSCLLGHKLPLSLKGIVPPPKDCYIADDKFFEADINSYEDVIEASRNIVRMCLENGASKRTGNLLGLFVEEMGKNIIDHGFDDGKAHSAGVRLVCEDDGFMIRLRDDCRAFNPVNWLEMHESADKMKNIGIRMVMGLTKDVKYLSALQMNSLIINVRMEQ
jgi:Na+-driven multidrug efflux pump